MLGSCICLCCRVCIFQSTIGPHHHTERMLKKLPFYIAVSLWCHLDEMFFKDLVNMFQRLSSVRLSSVMKQLNWGKSVALDGQYQWPVQVLQMLYEVGDLLNQRCFGVPWQSLYHYPSNIGNHDSYYLSNSPEPENCTKQNLKPEERAVWKTHTKWWDQGKTRRHAVPLPPKSKMGSKKYRKT